MASAITPFLASGPLPSSYCLAPLPSPHLRPCHLRSSHRLKVRAAVDPLGDFGAREATPLEVESRFGDKVLGNASTEHVILIPPHLLGLSHRSITPLAPGTQPLSHDSAKALLRKVVGWRLVDAGAHGFCIECEWRLKSFSAGMELLQRISEVAQAAGHHPDLHLQQVNVVRVSIATHSIGGLSENDFILAAKIDEIKTSDLIFKTNKFWA